MKLGKLPHKADPRTLRLASFVSPQFQAPPSCDWSLGTKDWPEHLNLDLGCCGIADPANGIAVWTGIAGGREIHITDAGVKQAYEKIGGYDPTRPGETDRGVVMLDVYKTWRKEGLWGHTIDAFALVDHARVDRIMAGVWLFGGLGLGFQLPASCEGQSKWIVEGSIQEQIPGSWGGHAARCVAYDAQGVTVISWGRLIMVSWEFFLRYCDEAFAAVSCDWLNAVGHSPSGFDRDGLLGQARALGQVQQ